VSFGITQKIILEKYPWYLLLYWEQDIFSYYVDGLLITSEVHQPFLYYYKTWYILHSY